MSKTINLGPVTAYADAVAAGYTGTREQFAQDLANAANYAAESHADAEAASDAAETATTAASAASQDADAAHDDAATAHADAEAALSFKTAAETAATTASTKAGEAANSASQAATSASGAAGSASAASGSATAAAGSATNAAASETAAAESATAAAGSASAAAQTLVDVNTAGAAQVSAIQTKGEETLESIPEDYTTLRNDVSELKSDVTDITEDVATLEREVEDVGMYTLGLYPQVEVLDTPLISFDDGADNIPVKSLVVSIDPVQSRSGDPSPTNVRPISGFTSAKIVKTGKNLSFLRFIGSYDLATGNDKPVASSSYACASRFRCTPNTAYTVSAGYTITQVILYEWRADGSYIGYTALSTYANSRIFTVGANTGIAAVSVRRASDTTTLNDFPNVQVELGSTATEYEAFGTEYEVSFGEAGTVYGGTLDVTNGKLTVDRDVIDVSTLEWVYADSLFSAAINARYDNPITYGGVADAICSRYPVVSKQTMDGSNDPLLAIRGNYVFVKDSNYADLASFEASLSNLQIVCKLNATAFQTYDVTPADVKTLFELNNIFASTGNIDELTYRADLATYVTQNSIENYTKFAGMIAGVETSLTATKNYSTGDYFIVGQKLYKATSNIANGTAFAVGTNCVETTVTSEIMAL